MFSFTRIFTVFKYSLRESIGANKDGQTFSQKVAEYAQWPENMLDLLFYQWVSEAMFNGESRSLLDQASKLMAPIRSVTTGRSSICI